MVILYHNISDYANKIDLTPIFDPNFPESPTALTVLTTVTPPLSEELLGREHFS